MGGRCLAKRARPGCVRRLTLSPCLRPAVQEVSATGDASPNAWSGVFSLRDKTHVYSGLRQIYEAQWWKEVISCDTAAILTSSAGLGASITSGIATFLSRRAILLPVPPPGNLRQHCYQAHVSTCKFLAYGSAAPYQTVPNSSCLLLPASATWQHTFSCLYASSQ